MWIMLNDCYFSIVSKDCARDELMVRARRPGDIEKVFTNAKVTEYTASDYHYRAAIKKDEIKAAMCGEIDRVSYSNFKSSVHDRPLHDAYLNVWTAMARLQPNKPYSGVVRGNGGSYFGAGGDLFLDDFGVEKLKPKQGQNVVVAKVSKKASKKLSRGQ